MLTEKFIALNTYISREEDVKLKKKNTHTQKNTLIFYLSKLEKEEQFKPNAQEKK